MTMNFAFPNSVEQPVVAPNMNSESCVFVRDLPYHCTEDELYEIFSRVGNVVAVQIATGENGVTMYYGYVFMSSPEEAEVAIQQINGFELQGRHLRVYPYDSSATGEATEPSQLYVTYECKIPEVRKFSEMYFRMHFEEFGLLSKVLIREHKFNRRGCVYGYGFVSYRDPNNAYNALKCRDGQIVNGILYGVKWSKDFLHVSANGTPIAPGAPMQGLPKKKFPRGFDNGPNNGMNGGYNNPYYQEGGMDNGYYGNGYNTNRGYGNQDYNQFHGNNQFNQYNNNPHQYNDMNYGPRGGNMNGMGGRGYPRGGRGMKTYQAPEAFNGFNNNNNFSNNPFPRQNGDNYNGYHGAGGNGGFHNDLPPSHHNPRPSQGFGQFAAPRLNFNNMANSNNNSNFMNNNLPLERNSSPRLMASNLPSQTISPRSQFSNSTSSFGKFNESNFDSVPLNSTSISPRGYNNEDLYHNDFSTTSSDLSFGVKSTSNSFHKVSPELRAQEDDGGLHEEMMKLWQSKVTNNNVANIESIIDQDDHENNSNPLVNSEHDDLIDNQLQFTHHHLTNFHDHITTTEPLQQH